jgi:hypothetical protein
VTRFEAFAEIAIEVCDGSPTLVEGAPEAWEQICFWSYRVVEEIGPLPAEKQSWGAVKSLYHP